MTTASLTRNSGVRLLADGSGLLLGSVAAVITARTLGPSGKGTLAALVLLGELFARACSLGLGEATVVLVGRGAVRFQHAVSATLTTVAASGAIGALLVAGVGVILVDPSSTALWLAVAIAGVSVPIAVLRDVLGQMLNVQERIILTSALLVLAVSASLLGLAVFLVALDLQVLGGVLAGVTGSTAALVVAWVFLHRSGIYLRPGRPGPYLRTAIGFGLKLEVSYVLTVAAARLDVLMVYSLAGPREAGFYSVALTLASVVVLGAFAISYATFPRLPKMASNEAARLTIQSVRYGIAASSLAAIALAGAAPFAVPVLFGKAFEPSVAPGLILLFGGVIGGAQWVLARAAAARGRPTVLVWSFATALLVMVALDLVLVPPLEAVGAAIASLTASVAGLAVCLRVARDAAVPARSIFPRPGDFRALFAQASFAARGIWARLRNAKA